MAQAKTFNWYGSEDAAGIPGMKADTTGDVVDSLVAESGLNPGDPVIRGTSAGQVKAVTAATDGPKAIGIVLHVHREPATDSKYYEAGYTVPVLTFGDVYVVAGGDVAAGDKADAAVAKDGSISFTKSAGANTIPGAVFLDAGSKGDIVRLRIRQ